MVEASKKREKQKVWEMWLVRYGHMTKDTFMDFDTFYKKLTNPKIAKKDTLETPQQTFDRFKKMKGDIQSAD